MKARIEAETHPAPTPAAPALEPAQTPAAAPRDPFGDDARHAVCPAAWTHEPGHGCALCA